MLKSLVRLDAYKVAAAVSAISGGKIIASFKILRKGGKKLEHFGSEWQENVRN